MYNILTFRKYGQPHHVEDRSARRLEQQNEALLRKHFETHIVELRHQRLFEEQAQHFASSNREKIQEYEMIEVLKRAQHQELHSAATLASQESKAEALVRRQTQ